MPHDICQFITLHEHFQSFSHGLTVAFHHGILSSWVDDVGSDVFPTTMTAWRDLNRSTIMERIRNALKKRHSSPAYEALDDGSGNKPIQKAYKEPFSWLEYIIFLLLGISMLWAW